MATHFKVEGLPPFDGEWDLDASYWTNQEMRTIKRMTGVRPQELEEAFEAGDNDLVVAFCVVALQRAGKVISKDAEELLWGAKMGQITFVIDEEEDASPPALKPTEPESENKPAESKHENGNSSSDVSENPGNGPSRIGSPPSRTGSGSSVET